MAQNLRNETKTQDRVFCWLFHASMIKKKKMRERRKENKTLNINIPAIWQQGILNWLEVSFGTECQLPSLLPSPLAGHLRDKQ